jgi:hypothetical protein
VSKWKEGSEGDADDGFKGKTVEVMVEGNLEGEEAMADGEKATPMEDPSEETIAKKT